MNDTDYKLLQDYYIECNKRSRLKTLQLLEDKEFSKLVYGTSYLSREKKTIKLKGTDMLSIMEQLKEIDQNKADNHGNFHVIGQYDDQEQEEELFVEYIVYTVLPESDCENVKWLMNSVTWKIKNQPNGADTKGYLGTIEKLKSGKL